MISCFGISSVIGRELRNSHFRIETLSNLRYGRYFIAVTVFGTVRGGVSFAVACSWRVFFVRPPALRPLGQKTSRFIRGFLHWRCVCVC